MKKPAETETPSSRRLGVESSHTRHALLDAAELIMREEGYAAVTSRHAASRAGLKPQLVYYYFRTMDDLFLAVFKRRSERGVAQMQALLAGPQPLHALWALLSNPAHGALTAEFMALANHRKVIGEEIRRRADEVRAMQTELLTRILQERGIDAGQYSPVMLSLLLGTLSQVLVRERVLGIEAGHDELNAQIKRVLDQLEPPPAGH